MRPMLLSILVLEFLLLVAGPAQAIPAAGFEDIIAAEAPADSFRMYRWVDFPDVYIIHFDTYLYQSRAFSRMAMYQEMAASRGRIMSQEELVAWFSGQGATLEGLFGAHDYDTEDLAGFYNKLWQSGEEPWAEELAVADALVQEGLLSMELGDGSKPLPRTASPYAATGQHAVISFATRLALAESSRAIQGRPGRRYEAGALYHEMRHGIFFTDVDYAARCTQFWQQMLTADERRAFSTLLASLNYDPAFEELMVNEFQAYLLTPEGPGMGADILLSSGRRLLNADYRPGSISTADRLHYTKHGPALLERIENSLGAELRDWLGEEYAIEWIQADTAVPRTPVEITLR